MCSIHRLQIFHRIPVVFNKDDSISACEVETKTADLNKQQRKGETQQEEEKKMSREAKVR